MSKVLVIGGVSYNTMIYLDAFPPPRPQTVYSRSFYETVGSTGAGKALNLHKLGLDVTLHGLIGDDGYGNWIVAHFEREGLDFVYDLDPQGTKRHVNLMNQEGGRISIFIAYGSPEPELDLSRIDALLADSDYVALGILNYCKGLIPLIKRHGKEIWCDLHDYDGKNPYHRDFIQAADCVFMSSNSLSDYRPTMQQMVDEGKKLVVCTHGREGASALTPDGLWIETPIIPDYPLRDSNGAGDSFFSGFMYGHAQGYPLLTCLRLGTIVAGLCITSLELALPDLSPDRVERDYQKHYPRE
jgi:sugar/nucleoside kinase (ribokinase family)